MPSKMAFCHFVCIDVLDGPELQDSLVLKANKAIRVRTDSQDRLVILVPILRVVCLVTLVTQVDTS